MLPAAAVIIHSRDDRCRDESDIQSSTAFQGNWDHGLHISITSFSLWSTIAPWIILELRTFELACHSQLRSPRAMLPPFSVQMCETIVLL